MNIRGKVIEVLDKEHGQRVKKFFKDNGANTNGWSYDNTKEESNCNRYYYMNEFGCIEFTNDYSGLELIALPEEKTYPRWVMGKYVECVTWSKRYCVGEFNNKYICANRESSRYLFLVDEIKEIEEPKPVTYTFEQISKLTGTPVELIRIKNNK